MPSDEKCTACDGTGLTRWERRDGLLPIVWVEHGPEPCYLGCEKPKEEDDAE